jgi:hypothetical protein
MVSDATSDDSHIVRYERLQRGPYFADFRRDKRLNPEVYHCVIQHEGSTEIIRWTQHRTLKEAVQTAETELKRLTTRQDLGNLEQQISAQSG